MSLSGRKSSLSTDPNSPNSVIFHLAQNSLILSMSISMRGLMLTPPNPKAESHYTRNTSGNPHSRASTQNPKPGTQNLLLRPDDFQSAHVWAKDLRHDHGAVRLLVV